MRIIDLALKDLTQLVRDWKSAFFLLIMPIGFTLLFGFVFGGVGSGENDPRLPVGYVDSDNGILSAYLLGMIERSEVIRLESGEDVDRITERVADEELVAVVHVPAGYSDAFMAGDSPQLTVITNVDTNAGMTAQAEIQNRHAQLSNLKPWPNLQEYVLRSDDAVQSLEVFARCRRGKTRLRSSPFS